MGVANVAIELEHLAASEGIDDIRGILVFALQIFFSERVFKSFLDLILPCGIPVLIFLQDIGVFTGIPARTVRTIFFDQIGALAKPGVVFGVVSARLSHILSNREIHFIADLLVIVNFWSFGDGLINQRIRVQSVPLVF